MDENLVKELETLIEVCDDEVMADVLIKNVLSLCLSEIRRLGNIIETHRLEHDEMYGRNSNKVGKGLFS
jgi:hypothetical protein